MVCDWHDDYVVSFQAFLKQTSVLWFRSLITQANRKDVQSQLGSLDWYISLFYSNLLCLKAKTEQKWLCSKAHFITETQVKQNLSSSSAVSKRVGIKGRAGTLSLPSARLCP